MHAERGGGGSQNCRRAVRLLCRNVSLLPMGGGLGICRAVCGGGFGYLLHPLKCLPWPTRCMLQSLHFRLMGHRYPWLDPQRPLRIANTWALRCKSMRIDSGPAVGIVHRALGQRRPRQPTGKKCGTIAHPGHAPLPGTAPIDN